MPSRCDWTRFLMLLSAASLCGLVAAGCDDGPVEDVSDAVDDMVDATMDSDVEPDTEPVDPCVDVDPGRCESEGQVCDGTDEVHCELDTDGCLVEAEVVDCAMVENGACDADQNSCVVLDPCDEISNCDAAGSTCDGDLIRRCEADALGCLVEQVTDCAQVDATCVEDAGPDGSDVCGFDPCVRVEEPCTEEGRTCENGELVVCERDIYNCLATRRYDCGATEGVCDDTDGPAHCTRSIACQDACGAVGQTCVDGLDLQRCELDRFGCLTPTSARCGQTQLGVGFCDSTLAQPACNVTFDTSCDQFEQCDEIGSVCVGNTVVDCRENAFGCLVESRTDCMVQGAACDQQGEKSAACGDPCDLVETCNVPDFCIGDTLVHCEENAFGCLVVASETNCADSDLRCDAAAEVPVCADFPDVVDLLAAPNATIPDNTQPGAMSTLSVALPCTVVDINVDVNISHSYAGDIEVTLTSPAGTVVKLHDNTGGSNDNVIGNYPGTLTVDGPGMLSDFLGQNGQGNWTLHAYDNVSIVGGTLNTWALHLLCD